ELERPERRRMRCPQCGFATRATYDRSIRTWRHLDALRTRCLLRCEVRRIVCPDCGVVREEVPWARPGSRFTRAFEDTCAFLVRDAPKTVVAQLMRIDWATVGRVLERVVDEALGQSEDWLDGLRRIGIDEVAYRKGHRYLLCVVDHDTGRIVWAHPGRSKATLALFFAALGRERAKLLEAVSVDLHGAWPPVIRQLAPQAAMCADPFHVIKLAGDALDALPRDRAHARGSRGGDLQRDPPRSQQRPHRGNELHGTPDVAPLARLSPRRVAAGPDSARVREDTGGAAHVNAGRGF